MKNFEELLVWQKSMDLVEITYTLLKNFPKEENYALSDQMRRAAVSIPSNIAEGCGRNSTKEFIQFLSVARGSNSELETQLMISERLNYITKEQLNECKNMCKEISKMISSLIRKISE